MGVWRLVLREIIYRKWNFALGLLSVAIAAGTFAGTRVLLAAYAQRTEELLAEMQAQTEKDLNELEDKIRIITKNLGFNILILPKDQQLSDLYGQDFAAKCMPEDYADRLAKSQIISIQHILPSLTQKLEWPEQKRTILLAGIRGEIANQDAKKPILEPVPAGKLVLGYELHHSLALAVGQKLQLLGKEFTIHKCHAARGSKDDITIWMNLKEAQDLLNKRGLINGILALSCQCAGDRLGRIRAEVAQVLPDTQVIEFANQAIARAETRDKTAAAAKKRIEDVRRERLRLLAEKQLFAGRLVPLTILVCAIWIGLWAQGNVRERRGEIGILRALGLPGWKIMALFLSRAVLGGLGGALAGYFAGVAAANWGSEVHKSLFEPLVLLGILAAAPCLACLAAWLPVFVAALLDPATLLREKAG